MAFKPEWITAGASAAGALYTMFGGGTNRQMNNSEELMDYQYNLNNKAMREQEAAQLRMFENTGYGARVEQIKRAGLNPALIYGAGASGGGGVTGYISSPSVSGQQAPNQASFEANKLTIMGMGLQLAKLRSEIAVNESVADANKAEAAAKSALPAKTTAETGLIEKQSLGQEINNKLNEIHLEIAQATKFKDIEKITALADQSKVLLENDIQKLIQNKAQSEIDVNTVQTKIKTYNAELQKIVYETLALNSKNELQKQEISASLNEIAQKWIDKQLSVEQMKTELAKTSAITGTTLDAAEINALSHILGGILSAGTFGILNKK